MPRFKRALRPQADSRPSVRALYFDFETDLDNLGGRNAEICRWKISVEVHCGEQGFSPSRHAARLATGDYHHPPKIISYVIRIDAVECGIETGKFEPPITSGASMKPK